MEQTRQKLKSYLDGNEDKKFREIYESLEAMHMEILSCETQPEQYCVHSIKGFVDHVNSVVVSLVDYLLILERETRDLHSTVRSLREQVKNLQVNVGILQEILKDMKRLKDEKSRLRARALTSFSEWFKSFQKRMYVRLASQTRQQIRNLMAIIEDELEDHFPLHWMQATHKDLLPVLQGCAITPEEWDQISLVTNSPVHVRGFVNVLTAEEHYVKDYGWWIRHKLFRRRRKQRSKKL